MRRRRNSALAVWLGACVLMTASIGRAQRLAPVEQLDDQWPTYGGNLASQRYSALDQIDKDNFKDLRIAWRLRTDFLGPRPDTLYSATPLYVDNTLYVTAGTRRAVIALDPATGEMLWMHRSDEGARGAAGARQGAGRGLAWWSSPDGADQRVTYVHPNAVDRRRRGRPHECKRRNRGVVAGV
jgi:glucose dehydrogenase